MSSVLSYSDGYRMTWLFDTPSIVPTKANAIDAGCLSTKYGNGMICVGVIYTGIGTLTATRWAQWFNTSQKAAFDTTKPLSGTDDIANWYTGQTTFNGIWSTYRW